MGIKISGFQVGASAPVGIPQYGTAPTYFSVNNENVSPQVTWSAPAYSTAIAFVTADKSSANSNGYMSGWTEQHLGANNGANWWEYIWVSTLENPSSTPIADAVATTNNTVNGKSIAVVHALNGVGTTVPTVNFADHSFGSDYGNTSQLTYTLSDGEFAVLCLGVEGHDYYNGNIVSIVSNNGVTWTKKSSKSNTNSTNNGNGLFQTCEVWYAKNQTGSTISNDVITITYTGNFDDQTNVIVLFGGVDLTNPWA